jgi:uncharacterized membrane protein YdbT with pleckstrin-like domain
MSEETEIWRGSPSQIINFKIYVVCGLFFWLVIPLLVIFWNWLVVRCTNYELTTERLRARSGVFSRRTDELELYRVRDYRWEQPFWLRIFGLGNLTLESSDRTNPIFVLRAIADGENLRNTLRRAVEVCKQTKRVREVDVD